MVTLVLLSPLFHRLSMGAKPVFSDVDLSGNITAEYGEEDNKKTKH